MAILGQQSRKRPAPYTPTPEEIVPLLSVFAAKGSILTPGDFSLASGPDGPEDEANPIARSPRTRTKRDDL
jgi:hypothetical protein